MASEYAKAAERRIHYPEGDETTASIIDSAIAAATEDCEARIDELVNKLAEARQAAIASTVAGGTLVESLRRKAEAGERLREVAGRTVADYRKAEADERWDECRWDAFGGVADLDAACRRYDENNPQASTA